MFAGGDGVLDIREAALYIAYRDEVPLSKLLKPGQLALNSKDVAAALGDQIDDLRSATAHGQPWTWQELDSAYPPKKTKSQKLAETPKWRQMEGLTSAIKIGEDGANGSLGPIRLRKTADDLTKKDLKDAKGATVGFTYNRLQSGNGAWNSEGILDYPIALIRQLGPGSSLEFQAGPAVEWNLAETQEAGKNDVQELGFGLPMIFYWTPGREKMTGTYKENIAAGGDRIYSALWIGQVKPYFQTDFSFNHEIYGIEASLEYVGGLFGSRVFVGGFQNIGESGLQYQLRLIPKIDCSETAEAGEHTSRVEGDDWVRVGALASFDLRLGGASFNPWDLGVSYQFLETVSGDGDYSDLFKAHITWWLSEHAGISLNYSRGETPVADKEIDLLALNLELKF